MSHVKIEEESGLVGAESRAARKEEEHRSLVFMMKGWQHCTLGAEEAAVEGNWWTAELKGLVGCTKGFRVYSKDRRFKLTTARIHSSSSSNALPAAWT